MQATVASSSQGRNTKGEKEGIFEPGAGREVGANAGQQGSEQAGLGEDEQP